MPWTRTLDRFTDAELLATFRRDRQHLMIKPNLLYGGIGIVPGWECTADQWAAALAGAARYGAVVQRRVIPRREPAVDPDTGRLEDWQSAWGLFVTPGGYAGAYARLLRAGTSSVISVSAHKDTRIAGVFTV